MWQRCPATGEEVLYVNGGYLDGRLLALRAIVSEALPQKEYWHWGGVKWRFRSQAYT